MLKAEGFDISTSTLLDIQKVIAGLNTDELTDFRDLKSVLSPFICRNKEEQDRFNQVFGKYVRSITPESTVSNIVSANAALKRRYKIAAAVIFLVLAVGTYFFIKDRQASPTIDLLIENFSGGADLDPRIGDTLMFSAHLKNVRLSSNRIVTIKIDDQVYDGVTKLKRVVRLAGVRRAVAWVHDANNDSIAVSPVKTFITKCEETPSVTIKRELADLGGASGRKIYYPDFINPSKDSGRYQFTWFIDDRPVSTEKVFTSGYSSEKTYKVSLRVDTKGLHCSTDSLTANLNELPAYDLGINPANPLKFTADFNWTSIAWILLYGLVLPGLAASFILFFKRKKITKPAVREATPEPREDYTGPYEIDFKNQNDKITSEIEISRMAEAMRKRHVGDVMLLNIPKTISKTIRAGGFPSLTFTPRTQPTDFLIFLDKGNSTGHQARLFEYIVKKLQNEQVNIIAYHFYKEPLFLSNEKLNHSMIPVDKVGRLYPNTVLIIFSNTEAFFQSLNRKLKPWVSEKFKPWQRKIIITPAPVDDWDYKETALLSEGFTVVPADLNAHQLIIGEINDLINKEKFRKLSLPHSYSSRFVNFDDWQSLKAYLGDDPLLLQWVCALGVYPYIDWKVTVAIGKAIENNSPQQRGLVTYTNLLKLSRIKWMQNGLQPDEVRLMMLHNLDNRTESIARDTIVRLLNEVEDDILPTSIARSEFDLNKTVNRFLLYTENPEENALTDSEKSMMKKYVEKQWLDYPLESYLNSANKTLLKEKGGEKSISPEEYFKQDDTFQKNKIRRELIIRRASAAAIACAGLLFLFTSFRNEKKYKLPNQLANISFNFSVPGNDINPSLTELSITTNGSAYPATRVSDSAFVIKNISLDSSQTGNITIQNPNSNFFIERPISLKWKTYKLSIVPPRPKLPLYVRYNNAPVFSNIEPQLNNELYQFNVSAAQQDFSDSSRIIYYETSQKARADSVVDIIKNLLKINVRTEFIEEIRTPQATPILFLNLSSAGPCNPISIATLPVSINEIWRGRTSNRLTTIDLSRRLIYYSTGDKKTYGTYVIDEICMSNNGSYKIITTADDQYKVFFIRSITPQGYELSACADFLGTKDQAVNIAENSCNNYDNMSLYYERRGSVIFVPMNALSYTSQAKASFKNIEQRLMEKSTEQYIVHVNRLFRPSSDDIVARQALIQLKAPVGDAFKPLTWQNAAFSGTPFDRDYIEAERPIPDSKSNVPDKPDCSKVFSSIDDAMRNPTVVCRLNLSGLYMTSIPKEIYSLTNLQELDLTQNKIPINEIRQLQKRLPKCKISYDIIGGQVQDPSEAYVKLADISFNAKYYPDDAGEAIIARISNVLRTDNKARIKLRGAYKTDAEKRIIDAYIQNTINLVVQKGILSIKQIETEAYNSGQQQQQNAPNRLTKLRVEILGVNFPEEFNKTGR